MNFKIYGERNSGVTFLNKLIELNFGNLLIQTIENNICSEWQHRMPREKKGERIDVFIVRDLNKWLISTYNNPYHLKRKTHFLQFLLERQVSQEKTLFCYDTDNNLRELNYDDTGKTIFEIRYSKYNDMISFLNNNKNVILVNQSYLLKDENVECFLNKINELFNLNKPGEWNYIHYNVKTVNKNKENEINEINEKREKKYNVEITRHIQHFIDKFKNTKVEDEINQLKFIIKTDTYTYVHG